MIKFLPNYAPKWPCGNPSPAASSDPKGEKLPNLTPRCNYFPSWSKTKKHTRQRRKCVMSSRLKFKTINQNPQKLANGIVPFPNRSRHGLIMAAGRRAHNLTVLQDLQKRSRIQSRTHNAKPKPSNSQQEVIGIQSSLSERIVSYEIRVTVICHSCQRAEIRPFRSMTLLRWFSRSLPSHAITSRQDLPPNCG